MTTNGPGTETYQQAAARLSAVALTDKLFILAVYREVQRTIRHDTTGAWEVRSPERCWRERRGDCSEKALLMVEMLKYRNIDARVVHGTVPGMGLHDTVEIHLDHYVWFIDRQQFPGFVKLGDGLHPGERVIS